MDKYVDVGLRERAHDGHHTDRKSVFEKMYRKIDRRVLWLLY